jgi:hypothetical protein
LRHFMQLYEGGLAGYTYLQDVECPGGDAR